MTEKIGITHSVIHLFINLVISWLVVERNQIASFCERGSTLFRYFKEIYFLDISKPKLSYFILLSSLVFKEKSVKEAIPV